MIQLLQAKNFRMLRSNSVALQPYQVLVGQNATGKSTLLGASPIDRRCPPGRGKFCC